MRAEAQKQTLAISDSEALDRLAGLENVIHENLSGFLRAGQALLEVKETKLYKLQYRTFQEWAGSKFGISRRRAYELIHAANSHKVLVRHGAQTLPTNERQSRPLSTVPDDEKPKIWEAALGHAGEGREVRAVHVTKAVREYKQEKRMGKARAEQDETPSILAVGPAPVILADCPWQYESGTLDPGRVVENHYPTMSIDDIRILPVSQIATDNAVLFMWAPPALLPEALSVMDGWGFKYRTNLIWNKKRFGTGYWFRGQHELLLVGVRNNPPRPSPENRAPSVLNALRGRHSAKPEEVYKIIESYYPGLRKVELFARKERDGWQSWGNEVDAEA